MTLSYPALQVLLLDDDNSTAFLDDGILLELFLLGPYMPAVEKGLDNIPSTSVGVVRRPRKRFGWISDWLIPSLGEIYLYWRSTRIKVVHVIIIITAKIVFKRMMVILIIVLSDLKKKQAAVLSVLRLKVLRLSSLLESIS